MKRLNLLYTILAIVFTYNVNAQIVYTDITDGIPSGIDFNGDGTNEFSISNGTGVGDYITYFNPGQTHNNTYAVGTALSGWDEAASLTLGFSIDGTGNWIGAGDCTITGWGGATVFPFNTDAYIGLKIEIANNTYYGWVRVFVTTGTAGSPLVTYKDFAYQSTANRAINAGDIGNTTGISEFGKNMKFITLYPNPTKNNTITIDNKSKLNISKIEIIDLTGKRIKQINVLDSNNQTIDVSELNTGIYFISLFNNGEKIGNKKLIIE